MENNNSYGIITGPDNIYTDVSRTLKGAKRYATNHSYDKVGIRYNSGYVCKVVSIKVNNKWLDLKNDDGSIGVDLKTESEE